MMRSLVFLWLVAAATALAQEPTEASCAVISSKSNGAPTTTPMDGLKVMGQTSKDGAFTLPRGAPKEVQAVICKRSTITPAAHDYKVLQAGYTLYLTDELGRVAALGLADDQVEFNVLDGAMTDAERAQASARLGEFRAAVRKAP